MSQLLEASPHRPCRTGSGIVPFYPEPFVSAFCCRANGHEGAEVQEGCAVGAADEERERRRLEGNGGPPARAPSGGKLGVKLQTSLARSAGCRRAIPTLKLGGRAPGLLISSSWAHRQGVSSISPGPARLAAASTAAPPARCCPPVAAVVSCSAPAGLPAAGPGRHDRRCEPLQARLPGQQCPRDLERLWPQLPHQ